MVTLSCGHSRRIWEPPQLCAILKQAGCFDCRYVRDIAEIRELPVNCGNSPRLR